MVIDHRANHTTIDAVAMSCDTILESLYSHAHILNGAFRAGYEINNIPSLTWFTNNIRSVKKEFLISNGTSKSNTRVNPKATDWGPFGPRTR